MPRRWMAYARRLSDQTTTDTHPSPLRVLTSVVAHSGDSLVWLLIGGVLWAQRDATRTLGTRIWLTVLVTAVLSFSLKQLFRRQRPASSAPDLYAAFDRYSFPSGHAVRVGTLTVVLGATLPVSGTVALALWSLVVCVSRIALRVHFTRDVGFGLLLGWIIGALLLIGGV